MTGLNIVPEILSSYPRGCALSFVSDYCISDVRSVDVHACFVNDADRIAGSREIFK